MIYFYRTKSLNDDRCKTNVKITNGNNSVDDKSWLVLNYYLNIYIYIMSMVWISMNISIYNEYMQFYGNKKFRL